MSRKHYPSRDFPQIYRKIAAGFKILPLLVTAVCFIGAIFASPQTENFDQLRAAVLASPNDLSAHLLLSQEYLKRGRLDAVEHELMLAENLSSRLTSSFQFPALSVLGSSLSPLQIWEEIKNEPQKIETEIAFWEKVVADKHDYRDAYLQLTVLYQQLSQTQKAKESLQKAFEIDPNFSFTQKLQTVISR